MSMPMKYNAVRSLLLLGLALLSGCSTSPEKAGPTGVQWGVARDYSFAYWLNGWRKSPADTSPDILCFETGYYGFMLDMDRLVQARLGLLDDHTDYTQSLAAGGRRLEGLPPAELDIQLKVDGKLYRAVTCRAGTATGVKRLESARLWESGCLAQHFDLEDLTFEDEAGKPLACYGDLDLVAWPGSLTLTAALTPKEISAWKDAELSIQLKNGTNDWRVTKPVAGEWKAGERQQVTLNCDFCVDRFNARDIKIQLRTPDQQAFPVAFESKYNSRVARVTDLKRSWQGGYTDIRDYDEFIITVENAGPETGWVPFLLDFSEPANITGLCPILCDQDGVPTGIPVQLSKNWHLKGLGAYLRAFALVPAPPGKSSYLMRIPYGFYGTLPSASHAQLSLIGWGGNGRWDQLAVGCWGETFCLDMDMSCTDRTITDVRLLMTRDGLDGKKWSWTDAGWGGDWLGLFDDTGSKLAFSRLKTAYLAHGPCLTDVRYDGSYGAGHEVDFKAAVGTVRADDYARTFQSLDYCFRTNMPASRGWLHQIYQVLTPKVAYGNAAGLISEIDVPRQLRIGTNLLDHVTIEGAEPWWIAFPGAKREYYRGPKATGQRALIIRSYRATFGGKTFNNPTFSMPVTGVMDEGRSVIDLNLVPPRGVKEFTAGDQVTMELEWITLPRVADDYYGPNEAFRTHLKENPKSWQTVYREARGNDLKLNVAGGTVTRSYPVIIEANRPEITVTIKGGVGAVPIRFDGLKTPSGYRLYEMTGGRLVPLDQSVHGNDFWQTDYDARSNTYRMSFNLPLDGKETSTWILKRQVSGIR